MKISISKSLTSNKGVGDPSLLWDLDFTTQAYRYNRVRYPAVTDLPMTTFSRPSGGYGVNSAGLLVWFGAGALRTTDAGLTVEPAATQYLPRATTPGGTGWATNGAPTVTTNFVTSGGVAWTRVQAAAGEGIWESGIVAGVGALCMSWKLKDNGGAVKTLSLGVGGGFFGGGDDRSLTFNLQTGAISGVHAAFTATGAFLEAGSWIVYAAFTATAAPTSNAAITYASGGAVDFLITLPQLEEGSVPTSRIPTNGATAIRNADVLVSADAVISPTIVAEFAIPLTGVSYANVWQHDNGTDANCAALYFNRLLGKLYLVVAVSGVTQALLDLGAATAGSTYKVAARIATNDFAASKGGAACVTDVSGSLPAVTTFRRGRGVASGAEWGAGVRRIRRYSTAKTNAELQALSA